MRKLTYCIKYILLLFILTMNPLSVAAVSPEEPNNLQIIELRTGTESSATEEYLKFYNSGPTKELSGWAIQYRSSKHDDDESGWMTKVSQNCTTTTCPLKIANQALITIASSDYQPPDSNETIYPNDNTPDTPKNLGFASAGGQIRLISWTTDAMPKDCQNDCTVEDKISYGQGDDLAQTNPDGLIKRAKNADGTYLNTNNDKLNFATNSNDTANDNSGDNESGISTPTPTPESQSPETSPANSPKLLITELLPDPASPLKDGENEFIELYNPNNDPVNAAGYTLQAGNNWRYKFKLPEIIVPAQGYVSFSSKDTNITLANSGSSARLLAPNDQVVSETTAYPKAKSGQSWALNQDNWDWTTESTPGNPNVIKKAEPKEAKTANPTVSKSPKSVTAKTSTKQKTAKQAAATTKAASKKTTTKKTTKSASPQTKNPASTIASTNLTDTEQTVSKPINYWLLGAAGTLAGGYTVYEYRSNIARRSRRLYELGKTRLGK